MKTVRLDLLGADSFFDGYVNTITTISTQRSPDFRYQRGVGLGKAFGYGGSALLLLKKHFVLGGLPIYVRVGKYMNSKFKEAKAQPVTETVNM